MNHTIVLFAENRHGVLARIAGLFSGRGYSLESITTGPTTAEGIHRITLVCTGDDAVIDQIKKQLNRLVDIVKVQDLTRELSMDRELCLIKIAAKNGDRSEIFQIADAFKAHVMDIGLDDLTLEAVGDRQKIDDLIELLRDYKILETARSGLVSMQRGTKRREKGAQNG